MDSMVNATIQNSIKTITDACAGITEVTKKIVYKPIEQPQAPPVKPSSGMSRFVNIASVFGKTSPWIRVAGASGALAVAMGAYGAHGLKGVSDSQREVFETANKYHFIHSLALLAVPLTHRPNLVGSLLVLGTILFSGTCYCHGVTGDTNVIRITPVGGMCLIAAWISMIL